MLGVELTLEHDEVGAFAGCERAALALLPAGVGGAGAVEAQPLRVAERLLGPEDAAAAGAPRGAVRRRPQRLVKGARIVGRRGERNTGVVHRGEGQPDLLLGG